MSVAFAIDPRLEQGSVAVAELPLSVVRLVDDRRFPWLLLIPQVAGAIDLIDLSEEDRGAVIEEIAAASRALKEATGCDKLNVAALGNQVSQLHIHVIARFSTDSAWPDPVWGKGAPVPFEPAARDAFVKSLRASLAV
ncbi:HIT family protein [Blastochloris viridis]|uniref:Diadenosine tetraphosphate (Ap4A) hydrolase and other HIT family hydrolases n=1 Tax=Blastochloris viridis TaxID=1079 RepID=A0A0H5BG06_BLAVI|nr:HIT family protein [Blastochloris viridis]ALK10731.1 HIT domain protein [Blastochloris viridis]BAR99301.1 Diadenosine tetraphosphate (Ap4A) hydrolase and other HIT family hydrolases [Blastochloris viridis]CUU43393.1 HIT domain protein [Blastochloris viridis]